MVATRGRGHEIGGASGFSYAKGRRIPELPISSPFVQRFEAPVLPGPIDSQVPVALVNIVEEIEDGLPALITGHPGPNIEVHPGYEKIAARSPQSGEVREAGLGLGSAHVTEKVVSHHHVVSPERVGKIPCSCITKVPADSFSEPVLDSG